MKTPTLSQVMSQCTSPGLVLGLVIGLLIVNFKVTAAISVAFTDEHHRLLKFVEQFSNQTGIKVNTAVLRNLNLKVELLQRVGENQLPDVVLVPADYVALNEFRFSEIERDLMSPATEQAILDATLVDGKSYGIPIISGNHLVLYYNKQHIKNPAHSWGQLIRQKKSLPLTTELIGWSYNEMYWFLPFLTAYGPPPIVDDHFALNTKAMRDALSFYWSLAQTNVIDERCDYQCTNARFVKGQLAYMINGIWAYGEMTEHLGDDLGVAMLPDISGRVMRPFYSPVVMAFPNDSLSSNQSEELKQFATYFQSDAVQQQLWQEMRSMPVNDKVKRQIIDKADANERAILQQLASGLPLPISREMAIAREAIGKGVNRYKAGILDLKGATEYMQYIATKSAEESQ